MPWPLGKPTRSSKKPLTIMECPVRAWWFCMDGGPWNVGAPRWPRVWSGRAEWSAVDADEAGADASARSGDISCVKYGGARVTARERKSWSMYWRRVPPMSPWTSITGPRNRTVSSSLSSRLAAR